eukprot:IDg8832t1
MARRASCFTTARLALELTKYLEPRTAYHAALKAAEAVPRGNLDYWKGDPFKRFPYPVKPAHFGDRDSDSDSKWNINTRYLKATKSDGIFGYPRDTSKGDYAMDCNRVFETCPLPSLCDSSSGTLM